MTKAPELAARDQILAIVEGFLARRAGPRTIEFDASLHEAGLTSLDMVNLVLRVESACNVVIPDQDITPANFRSIAAIDRLVSGLRRQG